MPKDSPTSQFKEVLEAHGYSVSFIGSLRSEGRSTVEGGNVRELPPVPPGTMDLKEL